jgi:hypothetical protein
VDLDGNGNVDLVVSSSTTPARLGIVAMLTKMF